MKMAERTGFEPVEGLKTPHRFSKPAHSTTLPPLLDRWGELGCKDGKKKEEAARVNGQKKTSIT